MQFITSLLGDSGISILTYVLALAFVLLLAVMGLWLLKFTVRGSTTLRGRTRRLNVVEQLPIDGRRQLLLIKRDGVEHLLLIGGTQDLLVEANIGTLRRRAEDRAEDRADAQPTPPSMPATQPSSTAPPEHVREFARAGLGKGSRSLRHTGLLRPVSVSDPSVIQLPVAGDNPARNRSDSVKKNPTEPVERIEAGDATRRPEGDPDPEQA